MQHKCTENYVWEIRVKYSHIISVTVSLCRYVIQGSCEKSVGVTGGCGGGLHVPVYACHVRERACLPLPCGQPRCEAIKCVYNDLCIGDIHYGFVCMAFD